jgi:prepilin-type N-terminal cleavage/methylation domain-containing protein
MNTKARRRGFTLPEVLVTVTVVAVLAAVVVPAVSQFATKGDGPSTMQDFSAIRTAVTSYVSVNKKFPSNLTDLTPFASQLSLATSAPTATYTSQGYGLQIVNALVDSTIAGNHFVVLKINAAAHGTCDQIDSSIDAGTGGTVGSFVYDATANTAGTACGTTASSHLSYVLMPGTPGQ